LAVLYGVNAQPVKEHAFDDQASINIQVINLENSGEKICVVNRTDSISYEFVFYNLDYSEFKTVSIDLGPLFIVQDYNSPSLVIRYIAENVFDQNNDIDLLGQLIYYDSNDDLYAQVVIFNENGTLLFGSDVDNSNAWLMNSSAANSTINYSLTNTSAGAKMILDAYYFGEGLYSFDVYDLPGSLPSELKNITLQEKSANYLNAYPVPANDFVDIDYRLAENEKSGIIEIFDAQGKTLQKIRVDENKGTLRMPVSHYSNGTYFYKLNTRRGLPRTVKITINK
jgi:hypothetical protein